MLPAKAALIQQLIPQTIKSKEKNAHALTTEWKLIFLRLQLL